MSKADRIFLSKADRIFLPKDDGRLLHVNHRYDAELLHHQARSTCKEAGDAFKQVIVAHISSSIQGKRGKRQGFTGLETLCARLQL